MAAEDINIEKDKKEESNSIPWAPSKPKPFKPPKKSKKNDNKNPVKKAKDVLDTISGLPSIDIDDLISSLLKNTEDSVVNNTDWKSIYNALSSDDKNNDLYDTIKQISSLDFITSSSHMERINKYKDFIAILKKVPIIKKILRLYTANILAPDDISKISLKIVPKNAAVNKGSEEYISIENKYKVILDKIDLENKLYDLVFKTLFYGDMFIEILSSKRYLLQTLYNLQIPIKDKNIKINESALDELYEDKITIDYNPLPYKINIEWSKPIQTQLSETINFVNTYFYSLLESMNINENNFDKYKNIGIVKYIINEFFGDADKFKEDGSYKIFHEDFTEFTSTINNDFNVNNDDINQNSEFNNKKYSLDYLPIQATLSSLNIKIHTPDKIIILKDENIEYGYLFISGGIESLTGAGSRNNSNSVIGVNSMNSQNIISSSNFLSTGNVQNMGSNDANASQKLSHAKQISARISQYIKDKFEEYHGDVNINNMSANLQLLIADILNNGSNTINIRYVPPLNMQQFKIEGTGLNAPYGEAVTEDLLFRAKMVLASDINGIIDKFTNTGKRLVWTVNANTHQQAANRIQQASKAINKKTIAVDNCLDIMASAIYPQDNIFIAKINGEPQIEVSTVDLGSIDESKTDNMYQNKQLITGADVPPAHLGYEEWTSGKNTLSTESVVFAQTIVALQKQFSTSITEFIQKCYIAIYSYTNEFNINYKNILIGLNAPRGITLSTYAENINNLSNIIGVMEGLDIPKPHIVNMFWPELYDQMIEVQRLIDELNKSVKKLKPGENNEGDNSDGGMNMNMGGGDMSMDMGGGDMSMDSGGELGDLGDLADSEGAEEAPPAE